MVKKITIAALLALAASTAFAGNGIITVIDKDLCKHGDSRACRVAAPEIDPTQAISALMLLAGSVAVLRGRRSNIKK